MAVGHVEGDIGEVLVGVLELLGSQTHVGGTDIGSCGSNLIFHNR